MNYRRLAISILLSLAFWIGMPLAAANSMAHEAGVPTSKMLEQLGTEMITTPVALVLLLAVAITTVVVWTAIRFWDALWELWDEPPPTDKDR